MNSRSHSNSLNLTSHGSYQQQTFDRRITWESLISIRVQEKGRKSRLGKSHNIILANSSLVPKAPMATEQTTDKAVELGSFFTLTHSTAEYEAVWYDYVALIRTVVNFIRLSLNDRNFPQGAQNLQFMEGFNSIYLLKETKIPFVEI